MVDVVGADVGVVVGAAAVVVVVGAAVVAAVGAAVVAAVGAAVLATTFSDDDAYPCVSDSADAVLVVAV